MMRLLFFLFLCICWFTSTLSAQAAEVLPLVAPKQHHSLSVPSSEGALDTVLFSTLDVPSAFTDKLGRDMLVGMVFTVPEELQFIRILELTGLFYGGSSVLGRVLRPARIAAYQQRNVTDLAPVGFPETLISTTEREITVGADLLRTISFSFSDTANIAGGAQIVIGYRYGLNNDTTRMVSPAFGPAPHEYPAYFIRRRTGTQEEDDEDEPTPPEVQITIKQHQEFWAAPENVGNMNAYMLIRRGPLTEDQPVSTERWYLPNQSSLVQNYPNPFNPGTTIRFRPQRSGEAIYRFYTITGQKVHEHSALVTAQSWNELYWDASALPSGVYVVHIVMGQDVFLHKLTLVK